MGKPRFSEMLLERRRQLGLSIKQASNVLRLKEEVLIAFEEGDFDSIPKSGYAQGMLSSYARYLGLNAKTVVSQFSSDLFEHERGSDSHEARRRSRQTRDSIQGSSYESTQTAAAGQTNRRTYVDSHGFLPTSGGFAGDMSDFATTSNPRPRYSSTQSDSSSESNGQDSGYYSGSTHGRDTSYPQGRPYTSRVPSTMNVNPLGTVQRRTTTGRSTGYGQQDSYGRTSRYGASAYAGLDDVTTRRVSPSQYRDDMRLDNDGGTYQSAATSAGRRSSRNIANTQRPNVRRRTGSDARAQMRNRSQSQSSGSFMDVLNDIISDRSRVIVIFIAVLAVVLTVTIILSVRSCINSQQSTGRTVTVTATEEKTEELENTTATSEEERRARDEAAAAKAAETESAVAERTIEVTVDDGEVTWLEIEYDGNSDIAETVTGPWNRTYTVRQSISINVNNTTAVTVTEGGKKLEFDSKASGIGTITIQVSKKGDAGSADATSADGQTQNGQTVGPDGQPIQNGNTENEQSDENTLSEEEIEALGYVGADDGNYYGSDGYYDSNGSFHTY